MKPLISLIVCVFISANLFAQMPDTSIYLWSDRPQIKLDQVPKYENGLLTNIHHPSIDVYFPKGGNRSKAVVVIFPGGGHRILVYNSEGRDAAVFLNEQGLTAVVVKYRLFREHPDLFTDADAKQDAAQAIKLVKRMCKAWDLDSAKVGVMGFSAGGEMVNWVAYQSIKTNEALNKVSSLPAFQILVYPGPLGIAEASPRLNPIPAFLVAADNDECCSATIVALLNKYREAKLPVEMHLYQQGDHAFNMGKRTSLRSIKAWPDRLKDWLFENKISLQ
ncbi:MAG: alpha/beta hydrolase [Chitinophagaceae bacterium]|uniref:alpha/beta hydrolase n=1 Tax=unclassified Paraflavitalea TaxID=2798305 RepID=UPI003D354A0B|nr:alpha/beta hydrolase [Chitinophagaceae bacterium]